MNHQLAHRIYAGADMFLMPSQFEPCGLSQLISLRYGTVPIVRETGGLRDTVLSYNKFTDEGNGFSFFNYNAHDMLHTVRRAVHYYKNNREVWYKLIVRGMTGDYSWYSSANKYMEMYDRLIAQVEAAPEAPVEVTENPKEAPVVEAAPVAEEAPVVEAPKKKAAPRKKAAPKTEEKTEAKVEAPKKKAAPRKKKTEEAVAEAPVEKKVARKKAAPKAEAAAEAKEETPKKRAPRKKKTEETPAN